MHYSQLLGIHRLLIASDVQSLVLDAHHNHGTSTGELGEAARHKLLSPELIGAQVFLDARQEVVERVS